MYQSVQVSHPGDSFWRTGWVWDLWFDHSRGDDCQSRVTQGFLGSGERDRVVIGPTIVPLESLGTIVVSRPVYVFNVHGCNRINPSCAQEATKVPF